MGIQMEERTKGDEIGVQRAKCEVNVPRLLLLLAVCCADLKLSVKVRTTCPRINATERVKSEMKMLASRRALCNSHNSDARAAPGVLL